MRQNAVVIFDSNTQTFTIQPPVVAVPSGETLNLIFTLVTVGSSAAAQDGASFADPPVIFPHQAPPGADIQKQGPNRATVTETNQNNSSNNIAYCYQVSVDYNEKNYQSPDPQIINLGQPPDAGDDVPGGDRGGDDRTDNRDLPNRAG